MAALWLERGDVEADGTIVMRDASRWIYTDKSLGELVASARSWAKRGEEYVARVLLKDAFNNWVTVYFVEGDDAADYDEMTSEILGLVDPDADTEMPEEATNNA